MPLRVSLVNLQKLTFHAWLETPSMKMLAPEQNTRSVALVNRSFELQPPMAVLSRIGAVVHGGGVGRVHRCSWLMGSGMETSMQTTAFTLITCAIVHFQDRTMPDFPGLARMTWCTLSTGLERLTCSQPDRPTGHARLICRLPATMPR